MGADDFGYGPASHAIAIVRMVASRNPQWHIVGQATGAARELLSNEPAISDWRPALDVTQSDAHIEVGNFPRAEQYLSAKRVTIFVDALYWMWATTPIHPRRFDAYLALDFPGLTMRQEDEGAIQIIDQIVAEYAVPRHGLVRSSSSPIIINLGGATSPLGANLPYLQTLIDVASRSVSSSYSPNSRVIVTSSANVLRSVSVPKLPNVTTAALPHFQFVELLQRARLTMSLPGQSIVWEALQTETPLLLLPPSNYSHHLQTGVYSSSRALAVPQVSWDELPGYASIVPGLPELVGVERAFELGRRFVNDKSAQGVLYAILSRLLESDQCSTSLASTLPVGINGSQQAAAAIETVVDRALG